MKKYLLCAAVLAASNLLFGQNKILINPSVGYAWRTAEKPKGISPVEKKYLQELSKGFNFDIGAYYMMKPDWGLGLKYNRFQASSSYIMQGLMVNNTIVSAKINTEDTITFFGPSIYTGNFSSAKKHRYITGFSLGYISYKSLINGVAVTGSNIGVAFDLGYHYQLTPTISFGPQLGYTAGILTKIKVEGQSLDLPDESKEGLSRIALGLGGNFRF